MKAVIQTQTFVACARNIGLSEEQQQAMVATIAADPAIGDPMVGTGGCRKVRFAGRGKGKSGGYRTIHFNGADDVPVLLLVVLDKGERENISQAERNELKKAMVTYEREYRTGVAARLKQMESDE